MHSYRCTSSFIAILIVSLAVTAPRRASAQPLDTTAPQKIVFTLPHDAPRPSALVPLYVSFAALQGLDVATTLRGIQNGAVEANPAMAPIVKSPATFIGVKAITTAAVIAASEQLRKRHRTAAILMMVGANAGYSLVVMHNARVGGQAVQ
jgi:uncharacterized protein DUF5658